MLNDTTWYDFGHKHVLMTSKNTTDIEFGHNYLNPLQNFTCIIQTHDM